MKKGILLFVVMVLLLEGCAGNKREPRYTNAEWLKIYRPEDVNEARAMGILQREVKEAETAAEIAKEEARAKIAARKHVERIKLGCLLLLGGSVLALIIGPNKTIKAIGAAGLITAVVIFSVVSASEEYSEEIAKIGLVVLIIGAGFALVFFVYVAVQKFIKDRAFREVVIGNERFKREIKGIEGQDPIITFKRSQQIEQSKSTEDLIDKVKEKL